MRSWRAFAEAVDSKQRRKVLEGLVANASALSPSQQPLIPCAYYDLIRTELGAGPGDAGGHPPPSIKKVHRAVHVALCLGEQRFVKFSSSTHTADSFAARLQSSAHG